MCAKRERERERSKVFLGLSTALPSSVTRSAVVAVGRLLDSLPPPPPRPNCCFRFLFSSRSRRKIGRMIFSPLRHHPPPPPPPPPKSPQKTHREVFTTGFQAANSLQTTSLQFKESYSKIKHLYFHWQTFLASLSFKNLKHLPLSAKMKLIGMPLVNLFSSQHLVMLVAMRKSRPGQIVCIRI